MAFPIKSYTQKFKNIHFPEKMWIFTHPFVAGKAWRISKDARLIAHGAISDADFDGDYNGGQVDAFRHTLWMAMLSQKIKAKKVRKLGEAHEKGNLIDFRKKILEEGKLPDSVACEMDLRNNQVGINIGKNNKNMPIDKLQLFVKQTVLKGNCWIIRKDKDGHFLDENRKIIPDKDWKGKWVTPKVLVPSNEK